MEHEDLKPYKPFLEQYLERVGKGKDSKGNYICPVCGSGTGKNHAFRGGDSGLHLTDDKQAATCFSAGCPSGGRQEDIFGWCGLVEGLDKAGAIARIKDLYGPYIGRGAKPQEQPDAPKKKTAMNFQAYFDRVHRNIGKCTYLAFRGITSGDVIERFNLGFDEAWHLQNPQGDKQLWVVNNTPATPRLIVPTSPYSYIARDVRKDIPASDDKYKKMKEGQVHILNGDALTAATQPIFIVEGELDALSVIQEGGEAIGLGSASNGRMLIDALNDARPKQILILFLDADTGGDDCTSFLIGKLTALHVPFVVARDLLPRAAEEGGLDEATAAKWGKFCTYETWRGKDPNDLLMEDKAAFRKLIAALKDAALHTDAVEQAAESAQAEAEDLMQNAAFNHMAAFKERVKASASRKPISTGYKHLDKQLDGGIYDGLYIIGAMSSMGKTTFVLNVSENVAEGGVDVIYYSCEMSRDELMAKGISRRTKELQGAMPWDEETQEGYKETTPKSTRGILDGSRYSPYTDEEGVRHPGYNPWELDLIEKAETMYEAGPAEHLIIKEADGTLTAKDILEDVARYRAAYPDRRVMVVVDYLQLLASDDPKVTVDKQITDRNVLTLKQITRKYNLPLWAISSFNRASYTNVNAKNDEAYKKVTEASYKESGAIEYSADVLLGLNFRKVEDNETTYVNDKGELCQLDMEAEYALDEPEITVKVLKNRNGNKDVRTNFLYQKPFNRFIEMPESVQPENLPRKEKVKRKKAAKEKEAGSKDDAKASGTASAPTGGTKVPRHSRRPKIQEDLEALPDDTPSPF